MQIHLIPRNSWQTKVYVCNYFSDCPFLWDYELEINILRRKRLDSLMWKMTIMIIILSIIEFYFMLTVHILFLSYIILKQGRHYYPYLEIKTLKFSEIICWRSHNNKAEIQNQICLTLKSHLFPLWKLSIANSYYCISKRFHF